MSRLMRMQAAATRRLHRMRSEDEQGFVLVYVLLVSMLISIMVATVSVAAVDNIVPAQRSAYSQAATAAAEAGIQAYLAKLEATTDCDSLSMLKLDAACIGVVGATSRSDRTALVSVDDDHPFRTGNQAYYTWSVESVTDQFVRVKSIGEIGEPGQGLYTKKVLVADVGGGISPLDYAYYSTYETMSSEQIGQLFRARTIALDSGDTLVAADSTLAKYAGGTVSWQGVPTVGATGSQWCDAVWYTPADPARADDLNQATGGVGRYAQNSGLPEGYDWQEPGTLTATDSTTGAAAHDGVCQVQFSTGNDFDGPLYTQDAYLLGRGTRDGTGPSFEQPAYSGWSSHDTANGPAPFNTAPVVGGGTANNDQNLPVSASFDLQLPHDTKAALTVDGPLLCEYWGPTRIYVQGGTAYVTSPMTAENAGNDCYTSHRDDELVTRVPGGPTAPDSDLKGAPLPDAGKPSVFRAQVPVTDTVIYVHNADLDSTTAWGQDADGKQKYEPIFQILGPDAAGSQISQTVTTTTTATATKRWTSNCDGWLLGWLVCDQSGKNQAKFEKEVAAFSDFTKQVINTDGTLKGATTASLTDDLQAALVGAFAGYGRTLYTPASPAPTPTAAGQVAYRVSFNPATEPAYGTAAGCTTGTPSTATDTLVTQPTTDDPLFADQKAAAVTTQTDCTQKSVTATVNRMVSGKDQCTHTNFLGVCDTWNYAWNGEDIPQFDIAAVRKVNTTTKTVDTAASLSFPRSSDVTRYQALDNGPGDAYVEGVVDGRLSVAAEHDVVVTGDLTYTDAAQNATALVAHDNVRVYHPVGCKDTSPGPTTAGYCPNDTTGLSPTDTLAYTETTFDQHPSRQYVNLIAQPTRTIAAAVFALNGSFLVDNFNRGAGRGVDGGYNETNAMQTLTLDGGVYQSHHGAAGALWQVRSEATTRPTSGYTTSIHWDSTLKYRQLPYSPRADNVTDSARWYVVSTSTGGSP